MHGGLRWHVQAGDESAWGGGVASDGEQPLGRVRVRVSPNLNPANPNPNPTHNRIPDQVSNAPAVWEEDDALRHMSDVGHLVSLLVFPSYHP